MKLIIIEGLDNSGKDTLISKILEQYNIATIIHCGKPHNKEHSSTEQDLLFNIYIDNIINREFESSQVVIMNRSHYGEAVYGVLYRKRSEKEVYDMIHKIEKRLIDNNIDVRYIQLITDSPNLIHKNDDNKSISGGDIKKIGNEMNAFMNVYLKSILDYNHKHLIYINERGKEQFRSKESIYNEAIKFINE